VSPEDLLFVVLGNAPYRAVIRTSKQMVAAQIARRHPVLYVEPPPLTLDPLVKPAERGRYFDWRKGVQRLGAGEPLVVCPPPFRQALDTRWRFLDDWNQRRLGRFVEKTLAGFAYRKLVLISFVYNAAHVADIVRPDLFVYYCIDLFSEIRIPYANPRTVERIEDETIRRADVIFAISRALTERLTARHPHVHYAPHGVDYDLFARAAQAGDEPADLANIPRPRIGFVGVLAHWLDYSLLTALARNHREWRFCFVGPVGPHVEIEPLRAEPNIHLLGERTRDQVIDYLRGFDVCLVPFLRNELTIHANPLKVYEYLAAGRPVVSTPLPEIENFAPPVRIARDVAEFERAIAELLAQRDGDNTRRSMEIAAGLSWDKRVAETLQTIYDQLGFSARTSR
jgi:glycosyltransferase involved in cell wall biosynthesis